MNRIALLVGKDLHLDMARLADKLFDIEATIAERGFCLACDGPHGRAEVLFVLDEAHPLAAAARRGLEHDWEADLRGHRTHLSFIVERIRRARHDRHSRRRHQLAGLNLVAHLLDCARAAAR